MRYPRIPAASTLARHGLTVTDWKILWAQQGGKCGFCRKKHETYVIDHKHVAGWAKLPPEERRKYVRGIIGVAENHWLLPRYMTPERARMAMEYLEWYERGNVDL